MTLALISLSAIWVALATYTHRKFRKEAQWLIKCALGCLFLAGCWAALFFHFAYLATDKAKNISFQQYIAVQIKGWTATFLFVFVGSLFFIWLGDVFEFFRNAKRKRLIFLYLILGDDESGEPFEKEEVIMNAD
jgi:hypothetical protein